MCSIRSWLRRGSRVEVVKSFISQDGKSRIDFKRSAAGLYRFEASDDRYRHDADFHNPPHWSVAKTTCVYATLDAALADAKCEFSWLSD